MKIDVGSGFLQYIAGYAVVQSDVKLHLQVHKDLCLSLPRATIQLQPPLRERERERANANQLREETI